MTVSVLRNQVQYTGNGSTTAFTVNFPYTEKSQIKVYLGTSLQTITTHYTLTDPDSTGTVTFGTAPGTGVVITILRETDFLQTVDYANNDILDAETLESAFDKLTMMCQQVKGLVDKSVGFDETVSEAETTSLKLASGTGDLAGKLLAFDDSGNFVTTQEIGTFRGDYSASVSYVVRDLVRDASTDNVYFTLQDAAAPADLTDTDYFELLVDVETVRTLKVAAETARTGAETAETNAEAALASFQGQYKTGSSNPYTGTPDQGDLWYDTSASILKYYSGSSFEPVTTSLATVTGNYLTISNQVITAGTVPVSLGGTGSTTTSGARSALGLAIGSDVQGYDAGLNDIAALAVTDGNIIVGDGSNWVAESGSTARASLGVSIGSQVQAWDQQLDDISALAVTDGNIIVGNGTNWVAESGATARASLGLTIGSDVEAYSSTNADYADTTANFTGTLQNGGSNVLVDSDIGSTVQGYDANTAKLDATTSNFTGTLQNGGSNVVVDSDIGSTVQGYDADTAKYDDTTANFTGTLQNGGSNVVVDSDIGSSVQAYDADTAKYDDTTANFTGTLQNGGSNVLVDSDIGSTVQAAGSYLSDIVSDTTPQLGGNLDVNGNSIVSASNGNIAITPNGTGNVSLGNFTFDADQTVGAGQDNYVLTYDHSTTSISLEAASGGGGLSDLEHANSISTTQTVASGQHRFYVGPMTFSNDVTVAGKLLVFDGSYNQTSGTTNVTGTLNIRG